MTKHILIVTELEFPHQGGVSSHIELLIKGLSKNNKKVSVLSRCNINKFIERLCFLFAGMVSLVNKGMGYFFYHKMIGFFLRKKIEKFIQRENVNVVHIHSTNFAFTRPFAVPSVLTCHADITNEMLGQGKIKQDSYAHKKFYKMEYDAYTNNDHVISVDERLNKHVLNVSPTARTSLMINFIDPYEFDGIAITSEEIKKYRIPVDKKIILCPRRMVIKNGVIFAVETIKYLPDYYHLLIVGGGDQENYISRYILDHGLSKKVTLVPGVARTEMAKFYNLSSLVIIPSITVNNLQEATSISALEGMACGKVVIASNIGGLPLLINNYVDGVLFEEKNAHQAAKEILCLSEQASRAISVCAREKVIKNFGYDGACRKIIDIYDSLINVPS